MKYLLLVLTFILTGCGSSSGPVGEVDVEGDIRNEMIVASSKVFDVELQAVVPTSDRSSLTDITDAERLPDVSISTGIAVDADVINSTPVELIDWSVKIFVEDENFLTRESWTCKVCYPNDVGGNNCEELWVAEGNDLFGTDPDPVLDACEAGVGNPDLCVVQFPDGVDCNAAATYPIAYEAPGNGLWEASVPSITVEALSNVVQSVQVADGSWSTGLDKYARFQCFDENGVLVVEKDYIFNVVP